MDSGTRVLVKDAAKRYANAIRESLAYIDDKMCNNKFYKLINYDTYVEDEDEKVEEDETRMTEADQQEAAAKADEAELDKEIDEALKEIYK
jgi:hypothetical protein